MTRRILFITIATLICSVTRAQLLTWTPDFPVETGNGNVTIIVDASKGNKGLLNYTPVSDVYVHTGVITNLSTGPSDWRYVKFNQNFNQPNAQLQAVSLGNNKWQFTITGGLRNYYGVFNSSETILKISILFRNGAGTAVQRNSDGSDMYIPVYDASPLHVRLSQPPREPRFIPVPETINKNIGDAITLTGGSSATANLNLLFNGNSVQTASNATTITAAPTITAAGTQTIILEGTAGAVTKKDTIKFFVASPTTVAPLPAGLKDGINYEPGDTSVTLVLFAPNKTRVNVIGDFNDYTEQVNYQMNKTPDGQRFWLRIKGLTPGVEYGYQYMVDGSLRVGDYYTEKVLDPFNDQFIPSATYPNLKPYPVGKTTGIVSILRTQAPTYNWVVNNFARPDKRNLLIYELLLRDFLAAHDWNTLRDTLNYLKNMGINAIELLPFNEFEGNNSWGYNPDFYLAPDKYYGPKNTLKQFVDECHQRGIAVVMDIALNHSFGLSPMVQLYFDGTNNRPSLDNPWFNPVAKHAFNVGYDMNHESLATRAFFTRVTEHWLTEYKLDGFRFDLSKGFTQFQTCDNNGGNCNVGAWSSYDASRVAIWKRYYDSLQLRSPGSYVILEHFADNNEEIELANYGMMLWGNLNKSFSQAAMGHPTGTDGTPWNFEWGIFTQRGWTQPHLITYMESHDEERLMVNNITNGNSSGGYNTRDLNTALKRMEMTAAFCFMIPGPKMIWQFGETGYDFSINYCPNGTLSTNCRTDPKPIRWDYLNVVNRKNLYNAYAGLLKLRNNPLYRANFTSNRIGKNLGGAFKWLQVTTDTSNICVIGNFDVVQVTGTVTFQNAGTWYNYLTPGLTFNATGSPQNITLQPGEFYVYVNRNVNVATPVSNVNAIREMKLRIYPNPADEAAQIQYELPLNGKVSVSVLNAMGQQVGKLYEGFRNKGVHTLPLQSAGFDVNKLSAGLYLIQVEVNGTRRIEKFSVK
jgi:glycosidase